MEASQETVPPIDPYAEMGFWEALGVFGFVVLWFGFFGWIMWQAFRAHRIVPKELEGIRTALERIADQLEKKS